MSTLLEARGLTRRYGSFTAVDGVDLAVEEGTIHAVIGPNGAGKTTLFRLLTGIVKPTSGTLRLGERDITGAPPHVMARRGLAQSFQLTAIFPRLTVLECVQAAVVAHRGRTRALLGRVHVDETVDARETLARVGLDHERDRLAGTLSHGDQRALDVALALAVQPRVLLLDEPTAGMSALETQRIIALIDKLARTEGITVLFSEHDMDMVFGVSDVITVLHQGRVIAEGTSSEVRGNDEVMAIYLGGAAQEVR